MHYGTWKGPPGERAKPNPRLVVATLVAAHQEAGIISDSLCKTMNDAATRRYPVIVGVNAPDNASWSAFPKIKELITQAHRRFAWTTTYVLDMGHYKRGTPGMWRRDLMQGVDQICKEQLDDGGETLVVLTDSDPHRYAPAGEFFARYDNWARKTNYSALLYPSLRMAVDRRLPRRLYQATALHTRLLTEVTPFVPEAAMGIPLNLYKKTPGFRAEWEVGEGPKFKLENNLRYVRVQDAILHTSARRYEHAVAQGNIDGKKMDFGSNAPHREKRLHQELTPDEHQAMVWEIYEYARLRLARFFVPGGFHDSMHGPLGREEREELRNTGARRANEIFTELGCGALGDLFEMSATALDVDVPFADATAFVAGRDFAR
jgi:hypothetical protein